MKEIWKTVHDCNYLEVSNLGRIRNIKTGKFRKAHLDHSGYLCCTYTNNNKKICTGRINRLVAIAFIPNTENKPTVNHIDGIKTNNIVTNLEWATKSEQMFHAYKHNLKNPMNGINHVSAKLSRDDVIYIREHYKARDKEFGMFALAKQFNVSPATIKRVAKRYSTYYRDI